MSNYVAGHWYSVKAGHNGYPGCEGDEEGKVSAWHHIQSRLVRTIITWQRLSYILTHLTRVHRLERTTEELWYKYSNQAGDKQAAAERRHLDRDWQISAADKLHVGVQIKISSKLPHTALLFGGVSTCLKVLD